VFYINNILLINNILSKAILKISQFKYEILMKLAI